MIPLREREKIKYGLLLILCAGASALDGNYSQSAWWLSNAIGVLVYA